MPRVSAARSSDLAARSRPVLAGLFTVAGVMHFVAPSVYARIVPPALPAPRALVYASGAAEIAGGLGLLPRRTRKAAGLGLAALLLAVWPANAEMLRQARAARKPRWWQALLWARLPLQLPLLAWVWKASRD